MESFSYALEEIQKLLDSSIQNWFLGAGISVNSNIPLMNELTLLVRKMLSPSLTETEIFEEILAELDENSHVEHVLSHLGDLMALASRMKIKQVSLKSKTIKLEELEQTYSKILEAIGKIIRYGYIRDSQANDTLGTIQEPKIIVDHHLEFVEALLNRRTNLLNRSEFSFFTTNYDTLLEDALSLHKRIVIDGFGSGALAFWDGSSLARDYSKAHNKLFKLHGSVDWFKDPKRGLLRGRYGAGYYSDPKNILIYPQATKYLETQKDPFAILFEGFRKALKNQEPHIMVMCGYSFGDNHINNEIENALLSHENKTTLLAFSKEIENDDSLSLCPCLKNWLEHEDFGERIYVLSDKAIYKGKKKYPVGSQESLDWWTFTGLTKFLKTRNI